MTTPTVTYLQSATSSLRASATMSLLEAGTIAYDALLEPTG